MFHSFPISSTPCFPNLSRNSHASIPFSFLSFFSIVLTFWFCFQFPFLSSFPWVNCHHSLILYPPSLVPQYLCFSSSYPFLYTSLPPISSFPPELIFSPILPFPPQRIFHLDLILPSPFRSLTSCSLSSCSLRPLLAVLLPLYPTTPYPFPSPS